MAPSPSYRYRLFGLEIASDIALPELSEVPDTGLSPTPDLHIRRVDSHQFSDGFPLDVQGVAHFSVSGGRLISVVPADGASEREVRLFLLGSAMGIALHQRGMLPLHSNAIALEGSAVAFMGQSGAGKSTLAAWFHDNGYPILADDVCVVTLGDDGSPMAFPGLPRLRLWKDALEASGRIADDHPLSFHVESDERRKYDVRVPVKSVASDPLKLGALVVLEQGESVAIDRLTGAAAVEAISANTYRGAYIADVGDSAAHFKSCLALARRVPVYLITRPFDRAGFEEQCRAILSFCQSSLLRE
jgi:hypothetical protein